MKKLQLDVDALAVEQFSVEPTGRGARGTVAAHATQIGITAPCFTCPAEPTVPDYTYTCSCGC